MNIRKLLIAPLLLMMVALFALPIQNANADRISNKVRTAGTVESIDLAQNKFVVVDRENNKTEIFVSPATEFEVEQGQDFWKSDDVPFSNLKVGDWVKVKSYKVGQTLEADDVDIYRNKK